MSVLKKSEIIPEVERRLRNLSIERLVVANDFLVYLEDRESGEATRELINIAGFEKAFRKASQQADDGELISFENFRRDV